MDQNSLEDCLSRNGNNLDLIRILAAVAVIYGHSFAFVPSSGVTDIIYRVTGHYAADLAVKTFFFMSGLLVTNSLLKSRSIVEYVIHRFMRIMPGLFFVLAVTTFILGPVFSSFSLFAYYSDSQVFKYFFDMLFMNSWGTQNAGSYNLPGLFIDSPVGRYVNAPLWTLAVEVFSYMFILALFLVGALGKQFAFGIFLIILLDSFLPAPILFSWLPPNSSDFSLMPYCFSVGGLLAVYKSTVKISLMLPIGFLILYFLFKDTRIDTHLYYIFFFTLVLYISTLPIILKVTIKNDYSYGVYVWGWPLQQIISSSMPNLSIHLFQLISILLALMFSFVSWRYVERPSILLGKTMSSSKFALLFSRQN